MLTKKWCRGLFSAGFSFAQREQFVSAQTPDWSETQKLWQSEMKTMFEQLQLSENEMVAQKQALESLREQQATRMAVRYNVLRLTQMRF